MVVGYNVQRWGERASRLMGYLKDHEGVRI